MKNFKREDLLFSLCGLNCGLCPMRLDGYCPGCGGGVGNQGCRIARCSLRHGGLEYCFQCPEFPCGQYAHVDDYDSFITHRNRLLDLSKARKIGRSAYQAEQEQKLELLKRLLTDYNDGRKKTLFCLAVNLLELPELRDVARQLDREAVSRKPLNERAAFAVRLLQEKAELRGVELRLRKKPKSP